MHWIVFVKNFIFCGQNLYSTLENYFSLVRCKSRCGNWTSRSRCWWRRVIPGGSWDRSAEDQVRKKQLVSPGEAAVQSMSSAGVLHPPASTDTPKGRGSRSRRSVTRRTSTQQEARLADRQRVERAQKKTFLPPQVLKKLLLIRNRTIKRVKLLIVTLVVITAILLVTVSHQTVILTQTMRMKYQNENPQTTKVAHLIHHPSNLPRYHQFQHHHKTRQNRFDRPIHFIPNRL